MTGILDQLGIDPVYLFAILFILQITLIVLLIMLYSKYKRLQKSYSVFMREETEKIWKKASLRNSDSWMKYLTW